jgi:Xaa-Pro aminopeptidase
MNEIQKTISELKKINVDIAIITSNENATYVSGFEIPLYIGPFSCIANEMPLVIPIVDVANNEVLMVACEEYRSLIEKDSQIKKIFYYTVFGNLRKIDTTQSFLEALNKAFDEISVGKSSKANIGIEYRSCSFLILDCVLKKMGDKNPLEITKALESARRIKTEREIELLRNAAKMLDLVQGAFNNLSLKSDINEFEIYEDAIGVMTRNAGKLIPITGELVVGKRTSEVKWPGGPKNSIISKGDIGILDISPRLNGYWGDCSNVVVFGEKPNSSQTKYFHVVREAFNLVLDVLRPGINCSEIFNIVNSCYEKYGFKVPHYCGHQVGVGVNESPRFVPYDKSIIESGMVFCLELGLYEGPGGMTGIRCEKMIQITEGGYELLNNFNWGIE